jgi:predicted nucleic acid-binding protein
MMRILLDTDVLLDLMLDRPGFADAAAILWQAHEQERLEAYVSAITPVNVYYIARKLKGAEIARQAVRDVVTTLRVCPLDHAALVGALDLPFADYEDAVQHASAVALQLDGIVTRNTEDYRGATITIYSPVELAKQFSA